MFGNLIWSGICRWAAEPSLNVRKESMTRNCMQLKVWFETSFDCEQSLCLISGNCDDAYNLTIYVHLSFRFTFASICVQHVYTSTKQSKVTHRNVQQSIWLKIFFRCCCGCRSHLLLFTIWFDRCSSFNVCVCFMWWVLFVFAWIFFV